MNQTQGALVGASIFSVALIGIAVAVALHYSAPTAPNAPLPTATPIAAAIALPPPTPPEQSLADRLLTVQDFDLAVQATKPGMEDVRENDSVGTELFARWATWRLRWQDVGVTKDETSFALVQKDSESERGKRLCVTGPIIEIEVQKTDIGRTSTGLMRSWSSNLFHFIAVGTSGELVEHSTARLCGVTTGRYDYGNSGGGVGHAVTIVGMFDLPENRTRRPPSATAGLATH